ncbi:hypothetical protein LguiA_005964 [Lonicera macranthoides]
MAIDYLHAPIQGNALAVDLSLRQLSFLADVGLNRVGLNRVGFISLNELDWIEIIRDTDNQRKMSEPPKYAYPYPAQGYYQGPPVMAPPQYYAAPPPRREPNMKPQSYQPRSLPFEGEFLLYSLDKSIDSSQKFSV